MKQQDIVRDRPTQLVLICEEPCDVVFVGERTTACPSCGEVAKVVRPRWSPESVDTSHLFGKPVESVRPRKDLL